MTECASLCVRCVILMIYFRKMRCEKGALTAMHFDLGHFFFAGVESNRRARNARAGATARASRAAAGARTRGCGGGRRPVATRAIAPSQAAAMAGDDTGGRERKTRRRDTPGTGENSAVAPREENVMPAPAAADASNGAEASTVARAETMRQALLLVTRAVGVNAAEVAKARAEADELADLLLGKYASAPDSRRCFGGAIERYPDDVCSPPDYDEECLLDAVRRGRLHALRHLLREGHVHGACLGAQYADGRTALMLAAEANNPVMVRALLDAGANAGYHPYECPYPCAMACAVENGSVACLQLLLAKLDDGADADFDPFDRGECPYTCAMPRAAEKGSHACLQLLLEKRSAGGPMGKLTQTYGDEQLDTRRGWDAIELAASENELLLEVLDLAMKSRSKECVQLIIDDIACRMRNDIAWAAKAGVVEVLTTLLEGYDAYVDKARKNDGQEWPRLTDVDWARALVNASDGHSEGHERCVEVLRARASTSRGP